MTIGPPMPDDAPEPSVNGEADSEPAVVPVGDEEPVDAPATGEPTGAPAAEPTGAPAAEPTGAPAVTPAEPAPQPGTGRNLPVALGVGLGLGGLALVTLFTIKLTFLVYMTAVAGIALWELTRALGLRDIRLPLPPVAVGGVAAVALAYWQGERGLIACVALTAVAILGWRLPGGMQGYLRDVTAGVFALVYLPMLASFIALMLAAPDGSQRTLIFLILTVCCDVGGYFAGILFGRHRMAPLISPRKTWEGFAGSVIACLLGGMIALPIVLNGTVWQGALIGLGALASATLGDLTVSMIKRDLQIKDMGTLLPGHGGIMDRADSLLATAPVVWLLLLVFIPLPR
jgi:phosphatidate cytidylyltransferase